MTKDKRWTFLRALTPSMHLPSLSMYSREAHRTVKMHKDDEDIEHKGFSNSFHRSTDTPSQISTRSWLPVIVSEKVVFLLSIDDLTKHIISKNMIECTHHLDILYIVTDGRIVERTNRRPEEKNNRMMSLRKREGERESDASARYRQTIGIQ